jgi:hypothetical protein
MHILEYTSTSCIYSIIYPSHLWIRALQLYACLTIPDESQVCSLTNTFINLRTLIEIGLPDCMGLSGDRGSSHVRQSVNVLVTICGLSLSTIGLA